MNFDLNRDATISDIISGVKTHGIVRINNYISESDISPIKKEIAGLLASASDDGSYKFGKAIRVPREEFQLNSPTLIEFDKSWMKSVVEGYVSLPFSFNHVVFATHDFRNDQGTERNGYLHFDKGWAFKFFIYLTDIEANDGPFSCIPGTHILGKELRESAWSETKDYTKVRNRVLEDYSDLSHYESDIVPITGQVGTMLVFDTDCFHLGGAVKNEGQRMIARSHTILI